MDFPKLNSKEKERESHCSGQKSIAITDQSLKTKTQSYPKLKMLSSLIWAKTSFQHTFRELKEFPNRKDRAVLNSEKVTKLAIII